MKKVIAGVLILSLLLVGCTVSENPESSQKAETEQIPETTAESIRETEGTAPAALKEADYGVVNFWEDSMDVYAPEDSSFKLLDFSFTWPHVYSFRHPEAAEKITEDLRKETEKFVEGTHQEGDFIKPMGREAAEKMAAENRTMLGDAFFPCAAERTYEVTRLDEAVLSIQVTDYLYMGGAHPSFSTYCLNYDMETGERLTYQTVAVGANGLWAEVMEKMVALAESDPEISGRIDWFQKEEYYDAFAPLNQEGRWHLRGDQFVIDSQEYELGSYAAGTIRFSIPMEELKDQILPRYMPAASGDGSLLVAEDTGYLMIDRVERGELGREFYLQADGRVSDIRIVSLMPGEDGDFYEGETLWYGGFMKDSALSLHLDLSGVGPRYGVFYKDKDGNLHRAVLLESGEDGSLILSEDIQIRSAGPTPFA